jgi:hypothetical protein
MLLRFDRRNDRLLNRGMRAELERYFFLDDIDRDLVEPKRRGHNERGFRRPS